MVKITNSGRSSSFTTFKREQEGAGRGFFFFRHPLSMFLSEFLLTEMEGEFDPDAFILEEEEAKAKRMSSHALITNPETLTAGFFHLSQQMSRTAAAVGAAADPPPRTRGRPAKGSSKQKKGLAALAMANAALARGISPPKRARRGRKAAAPAQEEGEEEELLSVGSSELTSGDSWSGDEEGKQPNRVVRPQGVAQFGELFKRFEETQKDHPTATSSIKKFGDF